VNEQLSKQTKDELIKLANELSVWDWGSNSISKKINECDLDLSKDIRMEPIYELKLASNLLSNLNEIDEIKDNNDKRIRLGQLMERQLAGSWMWGYAKVLLSLSNIEDDREKNKMQLNEAFSILQRYCPPEIAINEAQGHFALALADNGFISDALFQAQRSVALSPEKSLDRSVLSYVYQHFNSFEESNSQLEICMSIDPGYDYSYESMAWSKLEAINQLRNQKARELELKKYIEIMQNYIEIQQSKTLPDQNTAYKNINSRAKAYFWLGTAYHKLNDYDMAISNLEKARKLLYSNKKLILLAMLSLGIVYFDIKAYSKSESVFKDLIKNINNNAPVEDSKTQSIPQSIEHSSDQIGAGSSDSPQKFLIDLIKYERELIGYDLIYPPVSVGYILARACLRLSISFIQRDANLPEANYLIERAARTIANLDDREQKNRERKIRLDAMCDDCMGCLIYRQLKLGYYEKNRIIECINYLEDAVNKDARPEYYLHLAQALEYKLDANERTSEKADSVEASSNLILTHALACCDHVAELDLQNKYSEQAKELQKRLEKLGKNISTNE
ncbi:MAG TPA: tetratricopeptide repeat protein, partial [Methanothrix sp.]|nr:tetratricopeptide repeat protein [Methanothrix sp.]